MSELDKYLGKQASTLSRDVVDHLLEKGYTISPRSGRVRKKIFKKKKFYERSRFKKAGRIALIVLLILVFLASLFVIMPQLNQPQQQQNKGTKTGR